MNDQEFNNFKQEKLRQVDELRKRWNDKFLSDHKENRNNRILLMQNISTIVAGLIGAGIFFEKILLQLSAVFRFPQIPNVLIGQYP